MNEDFTIMRKNGPDLEFSGEEIGSVSTLYPGETLGEGASNRWTELHLYKTEKGKYVASCLGMSTYPGEKTISNSVVCNNHDQIKAFFGYRWLAKEMYDLCDINYSVQVD